jgi:hypothetical protein
MQSMFRKSIVFAALSLLSWSVSAQAISFPDPAFKSTLISYGVDTNNDKEIQVTEAESVTNLSFTNNYVTSVEGLRYFINLTTLKISSDKITEVNLSELTKLTSLELSYCDLGSLDVSKNTALKTLLISRSKISVLNLSNNKELELFSCVDNRLTTLDLKNNTKLKKVYVNYNMLTSIDVSANTELTRLECDHNQLTNLNLSQNDKLEILRCHDNKLQMLDVTDKPALIELFCQNNLLKELDASACPKIVEFTCENNQLEKLILNPAHKMLRCFNNKLRSLDLSENHKFYFLDCTGNPDLNYICVDSISKFEGNASMHKDAAARWTEGCDKETGTNVITALPGVSADHEFAVHPNPAEDVLIFGKNSVRFTLINSVGEIVLEGSGLSADISQIPAGIYLVGIQDDQAVMTVHKVLKK